MKKLFISATIRLLTLVVMLSTANAAFAQAPPEGIQYQAVARDLTGAEISGGSINVQFKIHSVTATGTIVYQETNVTTTNPFGLFTLKIGMGTPVIGTFALINWGASDHFLEVEVDYGGSGYISMGSTQLLSVPYALYAKNVLNGVPGPIGPSGIACWDLNGDGIGNLSEDINGDTFFNALDCKGADGAPSTVPGPPGSANISGTINNIVKFIGATTGGNSQIFDNGIGVGIGTAAPSATLDIFNSANPQVKLTRTGGGSFTFDYNSTSTSILNYDATPLFLCVGAGAPSRMNIQPNGDVGIGTGVFIPSSKLDVLGTASMTGFRMSTGATAGYVLTSDATGTGTWNLPLVNVGTGITNYFTKWNAAGTGLTSTSLLFDNGTNVGIGTTTPSQKLEIAGNTIIPATNDYMYTAPKTHYYSVSGTAFLPEDGSLFDRAIIAGNVYAINGTPPSAAAYFDAGVNLPDGAVVTSISAYVTDDDPVNNISLVQLYRNDASTFTGYGNTTIMAQTAATTGQNPNVQILTDNTIATPIIDNQNNTYWVRFGGIRANPNIRLVKVLITYTVNKTD